MKTRGAVLWALLGLAGAAIAPSGVAPAQWPLGTATDAESNTSWPQGFQPPRLGSWTMDVQGRPLGCWQTTALHDHAKGWPGLCLGLFHSGLEKITDEKTCKDACYGDPRCGVWQFNLADGQPSCWIGMGGFDCDFRSGRQDSIQVQAAERVQHGQIHVYKTLAGMKVNKLYNFGLYAEGSQDLSIQRCKDWCYSVLTCQYWQYSKNDGCWVDAPALSTKKGKDPSNVVDYPLTASGVTTGTPEAQSIIAGEYIAHYCPPQVVENQITQPVVAGGSANFYAGQQSSGPSPVVMGIAVILILAVLGVVAYYFMNQSKRTVSHKSLSEDYEDSDSPPMKMAGYDASYPQQGAFGGAGGPGYTPGYSGAQAPTMNFQQSPPLLNQGAPYGGSQYQPYQSQPYPGHNQRLM